MVNARRSVLLRRTWTSRAAEVKVSPVAVLLNMRSTVHQSVTVRRAFLAFACALLLFAQHVGLAHAIWHAAQRAPAEQRLEQRTREAPTSREVSRLCALDVAFAQILGGGPPITHGFVAESRAAESWTHAPAAFFSPASFAPRSRGPPALV